MSEERNSSKFLFSYSNIFFAKLFVLSFNLDNQEIPNNFSFKLKINNFLNDAVILSIYASD